MGTLGKLQDRFRVKPKDGHILEDAYACGRKCVTTPADFRALHDILQRSDPFYSGFQPKSIRDYIREHQSWVVTALIFIICMVMHIVRTGQLLRKRTEELNAANVEKLESERRFHLLEKQNIVGQLSSVVAHEIRQPLAAVSNYAMALRRRHENDELDDSALAYGLERLVVESDRANEIVDYVQKYVRTSEKSKARIDVSELLTEMGKDYTDSNGEMFVELDVREGLRYYMDPMELNLMVRNLVRKCVGGVPVVAGGEVCEGLALLWCHRRRRSFDQRFGLRPCAYR